MYCVHSSVILPDRFSHVLNWCTWHRKLFSTEQQVRILLSFILHLVADNIYLNSSGMIILPGMSSSLWSRPKVLGLNRKLRIYIISRGICKFSKHFPGNLRSISFSLWDFWNFRLNGSSFGYWTISGLFPEKSPQHNNSSLQDLLEFLFD